MPPRMRTRSAGWPAAESLGGGTGVRVGRGGKGRRPREGGGMGERFGRGGRGRGPRGGNDERINELNGQGNDQGVGANGGVERVNENVEGVNEGVVGAPEFSTIIAQQLQNLLPVILAQVKPTSSPTLLLTFSSFIFSENIYNLVKNVAATASGFLVTPPGLPT
nr:hypothetical protein [Tanacetum cinerariifolium]